MNDLRHPPNKVPESLYIVHDPSNDQVAEGKSSKSQESRTPWEIGFRPYDILSLSRNTASSFLPLHYGAANRPRRNPPSIYVTATDDIEAAKNEVITGEDDLVMYRLDGRCEEMRKCAVFKASDWLRALEMWDGDENEDEDERFARQKRVGSEWLIWPSVPKEAVTRMSTRDDILEDDGEEEDHPIQKRAPGKKHQNATAGPSRSQNAAANKGKEKAPAPLGSYKGLMRKDSKADGTPLFMVAFSPNNEFPFSTIYILEEQDDGPQCLIHWGPGIEPSWVAIQNVDARAVKNYWQHNTKGHGKEKPKKEYEILFEDQQNKETKLDSKFLVKWADSENLTWQTYDSSPGVTRHAVNQFRAKTESWQRYQYK
ncbi:uncharacterized protein EAF01_009731 [Botrytis porri]|uniref:Chromo domain-containing protein n=1 Tax=Botrytis porri TaxID=87229 RepID=A0A4Z1KK44_9HELO|nr:uncharacterized protein EAF01_009731 [Botrytis porri]KAF7895769.1 hypothetical protein EAF01_009731 [Botrytis porri]TGO81573.1 hypothetical protein BPOR_1099g00020 [Botrytis porri]